MLVPKIYHTISVLRCEHGTYQLAILRLNESMFQICTWYVRTVDLTDMIDIPRHRSYPLLEELDKLCQRTSCLSRSDGVVSRADTVVDRQYDRFLQRLPTRWLGLLHHQDLGL